MEPTAPIARKRGKLLASKQFALGSVKGAYGSESFALLRKTSFMKGK